MSACYTDVSLRLSWQLIRASMSLVILAFFFLSSQWTLSLKGGGRGGGGGEWPLETGLWLPVSKFPARPFCMSKLESTPSPLPADCLSCSDVSLSFASLSCRAARLLRTLTCGERTLKKSEGDFLWAGRRISHTRVRNLNVSDCCRAQGWGVFE